MGQAFLDEMIGAPIHRIAPLGPEPAAAGREPDVSGFALHGENPADPVRGRFVGRGLYDERFDRRRRVQSPGGEFAFGHS